MQLFERSAGRGAQKRQSPELQPQVAEPGEGDNSMHSALAFQDATNEESERSSEVRIVTPMTTASSFVEVQLPMRLSHKWVAFACRTAGVAKPRWNRALSLWTTSVVGESGVTETITMTASSDAMSIRILAEWPAPVGATQETATARRLATSFVTTMRDGMRRRSQIRESYAELSRAAAVRSSHVEQSRF